MTHHNASLERAHVPSVAPSEELSEFGYLSLDHCHALTALHTLRVVAERELLRLSWLSCVALVPPALYQSATRRVIAEAVHTSWGDYSEARRVLSADLYMELLRTLEALPMCDLDWAMRVFALSSSAPRAEMSHD